MDAPSLEAELTRAVRQSLSRLLRARPDWSLERLVDYIEQAGVYSEQLASLTVAELVDPGRASDYELTAKGEVINVSRLQRAQFAFGEEFERLVAAVLAEAGGPVRAGYLRERVGGPRWKVSKALHRLERQGLVERQGRTSNTSWRHVEDADI